MIAITALLATVLPNVGPIEVEEKFFVPVRVPLPNFVVERALIFVDLPGRSVSVEI